jgi:multidrug efflux pump subunit AcrA (membrane-fusion protein)
MRAMGLIRKRNSKEQRAAEQGEAEAEALHQRALRLVDTRGVQLNKAEAELQSAIAELRAYATPEREQRVVEAKRLVAEARRALEEARSD